MAASAITAGVTQGVGEALGGGANWQNNLGLSDFSKFAIDAGSRFIGGTVAQAVTNKGGRVNFGQVAADAFGNALGNAIVGQINQASQQEQKRLQQYSLAGSGAAFGNGRGAVRLGTGDDGSSSSALNAANMASDPSYYASQPQSQGVGPWSDVNYVNGMDMDSDRYSALNARSGSDIQSDNYRGGRVAITIQPDKGLLGSMAAQGLSSAQQRGLLGQLDRYQQLGGLNPAQLQAGQQFYGDLDDLTPADARRGGAMISGETAQRAANAQAMARAENASEIQRLASRPVMQGGQGLVPAGATSWASGVDLIPRGGSYQAPLAQTTPGSGITGYLLDKLDAFQNTSLGHALQGLPPEGFIVGGAKAGLVWAGRVGQAGDVVATEAAALQRMGANNRAGSYWADMREAYQQSRGKIDFAHIEADVVFKANGQVKAAGGHFYNSPMIDIVQGTETVGANGVVRAQINLLGADGNWYLKTNSAGGISSLTPSNWSVAQAKGEMSQAWLGRVLDSQNRWQGTSGGVTFRFNAPNSNVPQWRGYPLQTP